MFLLDRVLRRLIATGTLTVTDSRGRTRRYGDGGAPDVAVRIADPRLELGLALHPELHLGEGYVDGRLAIERGDVAELLALSMVNLARRRGGRAEAALIALERASRIVARRNPLGRARRNVERHYDLTDALFESFLDRDRQYSCAYFAAPGMTLDAAQAAKKRHLAAKLLLRPDQRVLDIGCGWGGLAIELAREHGVRVDGVTLSREQLDHARRRAAEQGLGARVRFELRDWRAVAGPYDRIVSVGMFEHVGAPHFAEFFRAIRRLLAPGGVAVLHAIGRVHGPRETSAWIRRHIFPGGHIPALSEVLPAIERSGLWATDLEILRGHYAETLRHWRERFLARRAALAGNHDERFLRMWEFYLASSEMSFRHDDLTVFQLQLAREVDAVPLTRDYIAAAERTAAIPVSRDRASAA